MYGGGTLEPLLAGAPGVQLIVLAKRGRWDVARFVWRLIRSARTFRPTIVHGYLPVPNCMALLVGRVTGAAVVWGVRSSFMDYQHYGRIHVFVDRVASLLSRWARLIIVNSEAGRRYHAALSYPPERMVVVPNGIDVDTFRPEPAARGRLRREWGIPEDVLVVGAVGRVDHIKDFPGFVRAFAALADPAAHAVHVGDGSPNDLAALRALAQSLGVAARVHFVGGQRAMADVYSALDVLVSPSIGEGFSNVIAEAMACGVPCAVTDVGDSARIIETTGEAAPPGDAQALAAAIRRLIPRLGPELSAACRERVVSRYGLDAMVGASATHLRSLA
jgi:glycosyltransferase involved in cell wall biosynthesis